MPSTRDAMESARSTLPCVNFWPGGCRPGSRPRTETGGKWPSCSNFRRANRRRAAFATNRTLSGDPMPAKSRKQQIEEMLVEDPDDPFLRYGLAMEYASEGN